MISAPGPVVPKTATVGHFFRFGPVPNPKACLNMVEGPFVVSCKLALPYDLMGGYKGVGGSKCFTTLLLCNYI